MIAVYVFGGIGVKNIKAVADKVANSITLDDIIGAVELDNNVKKNKKEK